MYKIDLLSWQKSNRIRGALHATLVLLIASLATITTAQAADYVSVADNAVILYDAPSLKAKKIFLVNRYLPLEQVVNLNSWVKVRDMSGTLAWIEKKTLSTQRYVVVTVALAPIQQQPDERSTVLVQATQQVALEWLGNTGTGWVKVRQLKGVTGYIRTSKVWGY